jgi:hypothetical protein
MTKRTLLSQAVKAKQLTPTHQALPTPAAYTARTQSRIGTRMLGFHVPEPVQRQFKILAAEQGKTVQALLQEAVNDLFRKHEKEPIA